MTDTTTMKRRPDFATRFAEPWIVDPEARAKSHADVVRQFGEDWWPNIKPPSPHARYLWDAFTGCGLAVLCVFWLVLLAVISGGIALAGSRALVPVALGFGTPLLCVSMVAVCLVIRRWRRLPQERYDEWLRSERGDARRLRGYREKRQREEQGDFTSEHRRPGAVRALRPS